MVELAACVIFGALLILAHAAAAVAYKIETHSKKSIWRIMNEDI